MNYVNYKVGDMVLVNGTIHTNTYPRGDIGPNNIKQYNVSNLQGKIIHIEPVSQLNGYTNLFTIQFADNYYGIEISEDKIKPILNQQQCFTYIHLDYPFNSIYKNQVIQTVIQSRIIPNLSINFSDEGGFELPLTNYWYNVNLCNKEYLVYHNARQIRFVYQGNMIVGLRLKDGINYMTYDEMFQIKTAVDNVSRMIINNANLTPNDDKFEQMKIKTIKKYHKKLVKYNKKLLYDDVYKILEKIVRKYKYYWYQLEDKINMTAVIKIIKNKYL